MRTSSGLETDNHSFVFFYTSEWSIFTAKNWFCRNFQLCVILLSTDSKACHEYKIGIFYLFLFLIEFDNSKWRRKMAVEFCNLWLDSRQNWFLGEFGVPYIRNWFKIQDGGSEMVKEFNNCQYYSFYET